MSLHGNSTKVYFRRACPNCKSVQKSDLLILSKPPAETLPVNKYKKNWMGLFQEKKFFSYSRCKICGLLFAPIYFTESLIQELYKDMPPNMKVVHVDSLSRTQEGYFFEFKKFLPKTRGSFVEIGPDIGLFTKHCTKIKTFDKYWLFEPNNSVRSKLKAVVAEKNYSIYHDYSNFSMIPKDSVAACVMIHVLDHLLQPNYLLGELRMKMKKKSILMIVTHDERSLLARLLGSKWPAYCLQHPQIYNPQSIKTTLDQAGFRKIKQVQTSNVFSLSFLLKNIFWIFGIRFPEFKILSLLNLKIRLGNMLIIAVPK